ncbi:Endoplasmic reticulum-Golgi intermediate compartment protein 2 [Branchiostoma belcheri]|nr:Endoplasmic reticulum-Golgi intermediate compartment protein 2 [Branchiostoma belcheri]
MGQASCKTDDRHISETTSFLKALYDKRYSYIQPLPWKPGLRLSLADGYINLRMQRQSDRGSFNTPEVGRLAWKGSAAEINRFHFDIDDLEGENKTDMLSLGMMVQGETDSRTSGYTYVAFLHPTLQEFMAAYYIHHMLHKDLEGALTAELLNTIVKREELEGILIFLCGLSRDQAKPLLDGCNDAINENVRTKEEYYVIKRLVGSCLACLGATDVSTRLQLADVVAPAMPEEKWVASYKRGKETTKDVRMPQISTTDNPVEAIHHHMVVNDRRETVQHVAESLACVDSVHNVLSDILGMSKLSSKIATVDDKSQREKERKAPSWRADNAPVHIAQGIEFGRVHTSALEAREVTCGVHDTRENMRRRLSRVRRESVGLVRRVDAFPKLPDDCREKSTTGATVSLLCFTVIAILVTSQVQRYGRSEIRYQYEVDKEVSEKLNMSVDITVAMPCEYVGADVTNSLGHYWSLRDQMTYFELTEKQKKEQRKLQALRRAINAKRSLRDVILQSGLDTSRTVIRYVSLPVLHGSTSSLSSTVQDITTTWHQICYKVTGVAVTYNFSHRIDLLSFGALTPGILNPLDGEEKNTDIGEWDSTSAMSRDKFAVFGRNMLYQYVVQVVPTTVRTRRISAQTHQFAVTEREKAVEAAYGRVRSGAAGIYIAFELSSIRVHISEEEKSLGHLAVRLCGIIGGVYTTSGVLYSLMAILTAQIFKKDAAVQELQETVTTDSSVQEQEETLTVELH